MAMGEQAVLAPPSPCVCRGRTDAPRVRTARLEAMVVTSQLPHHAQGMVLVEPVGQPPRLVLAALDDRGQLVRPRLVPLPPEAAARSHRLAGWGPSPAAVLQPGADQGEPVPWLAARPRHQVDLWVWATYHRDEPDGTGRTKPAWWYGQPLPGVAVATAAVAFAADGTALYVPFCLRQPGEQGRTAGGLQVLKFRGGWHREVATGPTPAARLWQAVAWDDAATGGPWLALLWREAPGKVRWQWWQRRSAGWALQGEDRWGQVPARPRHRLRWLRLWLAGAPGGGAAAVGLAEPDPKAPGAPPTLWWRHPWGAAGDPWQPHVLTCGGWEGRSVGTAVPAGAPPRTAAVDLVGWWLAGTASLALVYRWIGGWAAIEGWILDEAGTAGYLGAVGVAGPAPQPLAAAVAAPQPVVPCRVPWIMAADSPGRPWPVPVGWLDALRRAALPGDYAASGGPAAMGASRQAGGASAPPSVQGPALGKPVAGGRPRGSTPEGSASPAPNGPRRGRQGPSEP